MIAVSEPRPWRLSASKNPGCSRGKGAPLLPHPIIRMQIGLRVVAQPARVGVDHRFEQRAALLDRDQLVDLLLVLDDREAHLGVLQDIGHLVGDRVLVDRHRNAAQCLRCGDRPIEPRPVVADDRDLVAAPETQRASARRPTPPPLRRPRPSSSSARCRNPSRASRGGRAALGHAPAAISERCQANRRPMRRCRQGEKTPSRQLVALHLANTRCRDFSPRRSLMRLCRIGCKRSSGSAEGLAPRK